MMLLKGEFFVARMSSPSLKVPSLDVLLGYLSKKHVGI